MVASKILTHKAGLDIDDVRKSNFLSIHRGIWLDVIYPVLLLVIGYTGIVSIRYFLIDDVRKSNFLSIRNKGHVICKGDKCLVIKENMAKNNYCMECAQLILQKAKEDLNGLILELDGGD
jgi:hypothetical protein